MRIKKVIFNLLYTCRIRWYDYITVFESGFRFYLQSHGIVLIKSPAYFVTGNLTLGISDSHIKQISYTDKATLLCLRFQIGALTEYMPSIEGLPQ